VGDITAAEIVLILDMPITQTAPFRRLLLLTPRAQHSQYAVCSKGLTLDCPTALNSIRGFVTADQAG
jgi:hypothetical protein